MRHDGFAIIVERLPHLRRRRQDERFRIEDQDREFPDHQHAEDHDPRRDAFDAALSFGAHLAAPCAAATPAPLSLRTCAISVRICWMISTKCGSNVLWIVRGRGISTRCVEIT